MSRYLPLSTVVLMLLIISYFIVAGANLFGTVTIATTAFAAPPASFAMYQGEYGYDGSHFWAIAPNVVLALYILALIVNWHTPRRSLLLISFGGFVLVAAVSAFYIFPEYQSITSVPYSDTVDPALKARGTFWQTIDLVRWLIYVGFGSLLLFALRQPEERNATIRAK
jgi:hypothetical protein